MPSGPSPSRPAASGPARTRSSTPSASAPVPPTRSTSSPSRPRTPTTSPQRALPTIAVVLGPLGGGMGSIGTFNPAMLVHGEQGITLHQEIPVEGELEAVERDHRDLRQGQGRRRRVREHRRPSSSTGEPLFSTRMSAYIRGEGGWGGDRGPSGTPNQAPEREPDHTVTVQTRTDQALLYRLSGRPQPAALGPVVRRHGWLRPADPARPVHLRLHRSGAPARAVRRRSRPLQGHGRPLLVAGDARRGAHREGLGRRRRHARSSRPCGGDGRVVIDAGRVTYTS